MITINNVNITDLVDITSIVTNDTLDESLASGSMVIPFHTQKAPYERFSEVSIDGLLYVVAEDSVRLIRKGQALYRHEISLIEPTKILQKRVIPNLTITQPKSDIPQYVFSISELTQTTEYNNTLATIPLTLKSQSQDTALVDSLTLKTTNPYDIFISFDIFNQQTESFLFPDLDGDAEIELTAYYDGALIDTKVYAISGKGLLQQNNTINGGYKIAYTPTTANGVLTFKARTLGIYNVELNTQDNLWISGFSVTPSQLVGSATNIIFLDKVIDKLLQFHPEFNLSETTRTRIERIKAPEFTFQGLTLYDALKEVANFVSAIVYLGDTDFTTIHFYFYDEVNTQALEFVDQEQTEYLDGFTDGFEINAANVIRDDDQLYAIYEPDAISWISVRANNDERGIQIVDNQIRLDLQHGIYKPIQVLVKGLAFSMLDNNDQVVNFPSTQVWDITKYVVESQRYNTLTAEAQVSPDIRGSFVNKSNTIYYTQGQPYLQGLGFQGTVPPAWNQQQPPNFAVFEAILNTAADEYAPQGYSFTDQYLITTSVHDLQFRIRYIPYSEIRLTLYKDNNRGKNIMYYNEQSRLNDMELLGHIAQENVNRSGNRVVRYEGLTFENQLALGSKKDNEVLVNYTISRTPTINKFVAEYAVGYANLSNYVGVDSAYRQYEVPTDTIVSRRDKLTQFFSFDVADTTPSVYVPDYLDFGNNALADSLFGNFKNIPTGVRPTYARIILDNSKVVQSTIDAYRMGRTLGLAINMLDNYSAGTIKKEYEIPNQVDILVQEDARYTDDFGRFTQAEIEFYDGGGAISKTESSLYPDNNKLGVTKMFDYTYTVNKDAREQYGFIYELVMQGSSNVIVYDGFVKYNRLATELTPSSVQFRFLDKGYRPERNLDLKRTILGTGSLTVPSGEQYAQIQANATIDGEYEGLIVTLNDEPIFAILTDDYDAGIQVTKYLYPKSFADNDYTNDLTTTITFNASAIYAATLSVEVAVSDSFGFTAQALGALQLTQYAQGSDSFGFTATSQYEAVLTVEDSVSDSFEFNANATYDAVLEVSSNASDSFSFNANATGDAIIIQFGSVADSFSFNATPTAEVIFTEFGQASDSFEFTASATRQIEFTPTYALKGYATATPVNIVVDFQDLPASSFTLQTFTQTIRDTPPDNLDVTVTAPSSYTLNGFTYVFVDWRVDETGLSSTDRIFTTTIDQDKTLRLRYIAFASN